MTPDCCVSTPLCAITNTVHTARLTQGQTLCTILQAQAAGYRLTGNHLGTATSLLGGRAMEYTSYD